MYDRRLLLAFVALSFGWSPVPTAASTSVEFKTPSWCFRVWPDSGRYEIVDDLGKVTWQSNPLRARFGEVRLHIDRQQKSYDLGACQVQRAGAGLALVFHPLARFPEQTVTVKVSLSSASPGLELAYEATSGLHLQSICLLSDALATTAAEKGYVVVPVREGLFIPADSGRSFHQTFETYAYEGCHMAMLGVVKNGAAALVHWDDPYVAAEVNSHTPGTAEGGSQVLSVSLVMRQSARRCTVQFLGQGDYGTIARAYREVARQKGWLITWDQKLKENPHRAALFGALDVKLWSTLSRQMNEASTAEEWHRINWSFDEVGQVAEHLKNDLKLDKVHFIVGGWIHRGYDNQHPDILPAAPECGGNEKLAEAARRVRACGYLFDLHDNYQDMYKDAPSWNEEYLQKDAAGQPVRGGRWAGGRAYLTCSRKALELARRPQNLEAVKTLTGADAYFIDTTYAAGLQECFDPKHPLTRADDMHWKQELSDYARSNFGIFGSECGREWAIPHADYFEGLTGVSGTYYHNLKPQELGATVVPLFEMVYRDCIALYGKYGYDINQATEYVLLHISIGRTLNYHSIPTHLYWKQAGAGKTPASSPAGDVPALYVRADGGWAEGLHPMDRFLKNTAEILSPLNEMTSTLPMAEHQFLTADRKVQLTVFGTGSERVHVVVNGRSDAYRIDCSSQGPVTLSAGGFLIDSPRFVAFCASRFNGTEYATPTLFTVRSLDDRPIAHSKRIRVFHGFGDARIRLGQVVHVVAKENVIEQ